MSKKEWTLTVQNGDEWYFGGHGFEFECTKEAVINDGENDIAVGSVSYIKQIYLASRAKVLLQTLHAATACIEELYADAIAQDLGTEQLLEHLKEVIYETEHLPKELKQ